MKYNRDKDRYISSRALELVGDFSESEIARIISEETGIYVSRDVVHGRIYRNKRNSGLELKPRPSMPYFDKYRDYFTKEVLPKPKVNFDFSEGPLKILVLNDLHSPFQHEAALESAVVNNKSADIVVTSEVSDMYSSTSFAKDKHVLFEHEVEEIIRYFEYLSENFPVTFVINSGHDKRLKAYITRRIRTDLLFLIETDLLKLLAAPFPNVITIPEVYYAINDALFTHLDKHSSVVPMRSAAKVHEWVQSWKGHLDIKPYRVLIQAHGHHSGIINYPEYQLVETGCLQKIPSWILRRLPMLPWVFGHCVIFQYDGVTDRNATKVIVYEGE